MEWSVAYKSAIIDFFDGSMSYVVNASCQSIGAAKSNKTFLLGLRDFRGVLQFRQKIESYGSFLYV